MVSVTQHSSTVVMSGLEEEGSPQSLVRLGPQIHVKPQQFLVITAHNHIVTAPVHVKRRNPFSTRLQRLDELLRCEIVQAHISLRRGKEPRLGWVELDALDRSGQLAEGGLRCVFG